MTSRVVALHLAEERKGPTVAVDRVDAEEGKGLIGDRYHGTRHRHVSVQSREELAEAAARLGAPVPDGATRRNVTLDRGRVPTTPGARFVVGGDGGDDGGVLLEVVRKAAPCRVMEDAVGEGARAALHDRGGAICRVLRSGTITVGDVTELPDPR